MIKADKIKQLKELKLYSGLLKDGFIPVSVNTSFEVHQYYNTRLHVNQQFKDSATRSKTEASEAFKCSEITIYRHVTFMNEEANEDVLKKE